MAQTKVQERGKGLTYLRCISNKGFIWQQGKLLDEELVSLTVGKLYKAVATSAEERERSFVRVVDNSGEDYLYPINRVEPVLVNGNLHDAAPTATLAAHVPPLLRDILQAEALASGKSVSALLREWIEERLDLPA